MHRDSGKPDRLIHSRLTESVFMYIATCVKEGISVTVRQSRLRADQTRRIANLSTGEFLKLSELANNCVTIDIDPDALDRVFRQLENRTHRDQIIEQCIQHDAPREMMRVFFGISRQRYAQLRYNTGLPATPGRHPLPSTETAQAIHTQWRSRGRRWSAEDLLAIADVLDVSLRIVWDQIRADHSSDSIP